MLDLLIHEVVQPWFSETKSFQANRYGTKADIEVASRLARLRRGRQLRGLPELGDDILDKNLGWKEELGSELLAPPLGLVITLVVTKGGISPKKVGQFM